jgi:hypothetical protein
MRPTQVRTWKISLLTATGAALLGLATGMFTGAAVWIVICLLSGHISPALVFVVWAAPVGAVVGLAFGLVGAIVIGSYVAIMQRRQPVATTARDIVVLAVAVTVIASLATGFALRVEAGVFGLFLLVVMPESWLCGRSLARMYRNYFGELAVTR